MQSNNRRTAPLTPGQRARKRVVDRQSQNRLRERRNALLEEAKEATKVLDQRLMELGGQLNTANQRCQELEAQNEALKRQIDRATGDIDRDTGSGRQRDFIRGTCGLAYDASTGLNTTNVPPLSFVVNKPTTPTDVLPSLQSILSYGTLPMNCPPVCLSDDILTKFLILRPTEPGRPDLPHLSPLLDPESRVYAHPVSRTLTDILCTFTQIATLPEQIANLYMLYKMVHWRLACQEHNDMLRIYEQLPDWMRPLPIQLRVQHPMWMDHIPWPRARVHLIDNQAMYPFEDFNIHFTPHFTVSWPCGSSNVILSTTACAPGQGREIPLNPVFEEHIRNLKNWTVEPLFQRKYPVLSAIIDES